MWKELLSCWESGGSPIPVCLYSVLLYLRLQDLLSTREADGLESVFIFNGNTLGECLSFGGISLSPSSLLLQLLENSISLLLMSAASEDGVSTRGPSLRMPFVLESV